jgi:hypothetical protein
MPIFAILVALEKYKGNAERIFKKAGLQRSEVGVSSDKAF